MLEALDNVSKHLQAIMHFTKLSRNFADGFVKPVRFNDLFNVGYAMRIFTPGYVATLLTVLTQYRLNDNKIRKG